MEIVDRFINFISYRKDYENPSFNQFVIGFIINILLGINLAVEFSTGILDDEKSKVSLFVIILLILFVLLDGYLVFVILHFRKGIIERENFIKIVAQNTDPLCEAVKMVDVHHVKKDGSNYFRREMELKRQENQKEKVFWYEMSIGTTEGPNKSIYPKDFYVKSSLNNQSLPRIYFGNEGNRRKYAIILNPILDDDQKRCRFYAVRKNWKNVWTKLVNEELDEGIIRVSFPVRKLVYEIILPPKYRFEKDECVVDEKLHAKIKYHHLDNLNRLTITAENVGIDKYDYSIKAVKLAHDQ